MLPAAVAVFRSRGEPPRRGRLTCYDPAAIPQNIPQREYWDGHPVDLGDAWVLRKGDKVARCSLVTHQLGFELRLITTDLVRSQVCRSSDEVLTTHEQWKAAMIEKGWT